MPRFLFAALLLLCGCRSSIIGKWDMDQGLNNPCYSKGQDFEETRTFAPNGVFEDYSFMGPRLGWLKETGRWSNSWLFDELTVDIATEETNDVAPVKQRSVKVYKWSLENGALRMSETSWKSYAIGASYATVAPPDTLVRAPCLFKKTAELSE